MIFADTNVLLDVLTNDANWEAWSRHALESAAARDRLVINAVIYAEVSVRFSRIEDLDLALDTADISLIEIPRAALFLAGKAFARYRRENSGGKLGVLPDFFIGAHAAVLGAPLITRDIVRYRRYFSTLTLIAPERSV